MIGHAGFRSANSFSGDDSFKSFAELGAAEVVEEWVEGGVEVGQPKGEVVGEGRDDLLAEGSDVED